MNFTLILIKGIANAFAWIKAKVFPWKQKLGFMIRGKSYYFLLRVLD